MSVHLDNLLLFIKDAAYFLAEAKAKADQDPDDINAEDLDYARGELANASNAIDDAMGEIDKLLAPDRTVWDDPHLP